METTEDVYKTLKGSIVEKVRALTGDDSLILTDIEGSLYVNTENDVLNECYYYRYYYNKFYLLTLSITTKIDSEWNMPTSAFKVMGETIYKIYTETFSEYHY
ncbi:TPA: hypothetical protein ACG0AV_002067 [Elizabethkingia anophelis]